MTKVKRIEDGIQHITILSVVVVILLVLIYFKKLSDISINNPSLPVVVSNAQPLEITGQVATDLSNYQDAFARLRVSDPYTLGDYKHIYSNDSSYVDILTGGASITYIPNNACVELSTVAIGSSSAKHQTKLYHHYQPGKSQYILSSFIFGSASSGCTKRSGYFDDRNGIYLEQSPSGLLSWNIRSFVTGTPTLVDSETQANWNRDKCNGTGNSGFNIDITKTQLLFIDFQWLGVGRVRCGFIHNGEIIVAHEFYHSNVISEVYLSNPSLPVRCEISSTGGIGSMRQICATVISEGGYMETGNDFAVDTGVLGRDCDVAGINYPILAIRLKNLYKSQLNRVSVRLNNFSLYTENHGVRWQIWKLPSSASLTGVVNWNDVNTTDSAVEYSIFPEGIDTTDGILITSGFNSAGNANAGNNATSIPDPTKARRNLLSQNFDSTDSEIFVLVVSPVGTGTNFNSNNFAGFQWREIL